MGVNILTDLLCFTNTDAFAIIVGIMTWLLLLIILFLIYSGCSYVINTLGVECQTGTVIIKDKNYTESYTSMQFNSLTKGIDRIYHPESFEVLVALNNNDQLIDTILVESIFYAECTKGDKYQALYKIGRYNNQLYVHEVNYKHNIL